MAGRGPAPKDPSQRRRTNAEPQQDVLPAEGYTGKFPPLPGAYRAGEADGEALMIDYLPETRSWYETVARSPQATQFAATDWLELKLVVAPLMDRFLRAPSKDLAAELRLQRASFGATSVDRQRLRWRIGEPEGETKAKGSHFGHLRAV